MSDNLEAVVAGRTVKSNPLAITLKSANRARAPNANPNGVSAAYKGCFRKERSAGNYHG
jgi:hypothetical protein